MIKVFSYLKSSFMSIILIIMLLIAQAFLDLELPDYTSRIINIGIQQNGIESTVPKALSEQTFNQLIMLSDNKEIIQNGFTKSKDQYELIEETSELKKELDKTFTTLIALRMQDESLIDQYPYMPDEVKNDMMEKIDEQMEKMPASMIDGTIIETIKSEYKTIGIDLS